ncbi:MAG TPA: WXG100 family type VII secretion target [Intrasporangium sp.]|jgi:Proteins of 100 residues with WXG.|uniref:WXG100 family type VII secretion target n=1 Tax=Intrasporangium sp. TaxID=1925024 RepID=UPI002F927E99
MAVYKKGMDADAVSASGDKLVGYKGELDGIVEAVNGAVQTIKGNWGGQDAEQFQSDWNGQRQVVSAAGDKLNEMGRKAKTNAETQKSTSGS